MRNGDIKVGGSLLNQSAILTRTPSSLLPECFRGVIFKIDPPKRKGTPKRLVVTLEAFCPRHQDGKCSGTISIIALIGRPSSLGEEDYVLFQKPYALINGDPKLLERIYPLYCSGNNCGIAFGLSPRQLGEIKERAKKFLQSLGKGVLEHG